MRDFKPGDVVVTRPAVMWEGADVGQRLGKVLSSSGHIIVELFDYPSSPVKCFRWEVELVTLEKEEQPDITDEELDQFFDNIDSSLP